MFEAEGNNLWFKFVNETSSEEDNMFLSAVLQKCRWGTERTMCGGYTYCWMCKSPAVLKAPPMYTLSGRSCPLNVFFAVFTGYLQLPRGLTVKQDTWAMSCSSAITGQISLGIRLVPVQVTWTAAHAHTPIGILQKITGERQEFRYKLTLTEYDHHLW